MGGAVGLVGILIGTASALMGCSGLFYIEARLRKHRIYVPMLKYPSDLLGAVRAYKELAAQNGYPHLPLWLFYCGFFGMVFSAALVVIGSLAATKN